jgi:hypothetical protein
MARTPKRLHGPAQVATGPATKYTVPAVTKTIIRHIHIQNPSGSPVTFTLSVGADAAGTRLYDAFSIAANTIRDDYFYVVVEAAEVVQAGAGTNNVLVLTINGDEITLG